ncbi:MAG: DUF2085 domain-containing protein [Acidobacteriota bacterium]|nr:DUF2085 domain-containing protein [Acidobacteriota bacterium]
MTHPTHKYVPQNVASQFRKQAVHVWMIASGVVVGWVALILFAPVVAANGFQSFSAPIYTFFGYICHQMTERSIHLDGHPVAVCSRCFGVYFGLFAGFIIYPLWRPIGEIETLPRFWLFLSLIPISIDWSLTMFGIWENTHLSRFVTGLILGTTCAAYIVPALVEIIRNLSLKAETRM